MAESKQYITLSQENGSVMISEEVITTIVEIAVKDVEGFVSLCVKPGYDIADKIGKKTWGKGMKIAIAQDNTLSIDCNVNLAYGQSVISAAKAIQEAITTAVESTAGVTVSRVNVNVCGIVRQ